MANMTREQVELLDVFKAHPDDIVRLKHLALMSFAAKNILETAEELIDLCEIAECDCDSKPVRDWLNHFEKLQR